MIFIRTRLFQNASRTAILLAVVGIAMAVAACGGDDKRVSFLRSVELTSVADAPMPRPTLPPATPTTAPPPTAIPPVDVPVPPTAVPSPIPPRPSPTPAPPKIEDSTEYKLAVVAHGGYVSPNDPIVGRYAGWLDTLSRRCKEPQSRVADMLVAAGQEAEKRRGRSITIQKITTDLLLVTEPGLGKCDELLAILVVTY